MVGRGCRPQVHKFTETSSHFNSDSNQEPHNVKGISILNEMAALYEAVKAKRHGHDTLTQKVTAHCNNRKYVEPSRPQQATAKEDQILIGK